MKWSEVTRRHPDWLILLIFCGNGVHDKFPVLLRFQNDREVEISSTQWFQSQVAEVYDTGYKSWFHGMTNVLTERGGSVVTHETRIREVPGSNPVACQPG